MSNSGFSEPAKTAIAILQRLGKIGIGPEMCPWCKREEASEFDHIEAKANGGNNTAFNGMFICSPCNRKKRAMSVEDWVSYIKKREEVTDVRLWLECKDKAEYDLMIGRKLRKQIGFKASEPQKFEYAVVPRPNPRDAVNPTEVRYWRGGVFRVVPLW